MAKSQELHIFFFPLMAPGHIIPMISLAKLFIMHGAKTTILTTPTCTSLLHDQINQLRRSGHIINLLVFSSSEKGDGNLTSPELSSCFFREMEGLRKPFDQALKEYRPNCVVTDMYLPWTQEISSKNSVPRLVFHTMGFFPLCVIETLDNHVTNGCVCVDNEEERVTVHGLPHILEMTKSQLHDSVFTRNEFCEFMESVRESELRSDGAIVNTFYELESQYADHYRSKMGRKAWHEQKEIIGRDLVERGVRRLMDEGEEKQRIRERTSSLKEKARRSIEKGGSSSVEMERLMQEIRASERLRDATME
ncbi:scopoletin glucosyltransferase-like protein [Carex littledalei]|uniref:Scopoletin glucosyltransferase-like protein n=1 Tax=Carex littledalei TaxID=544730 RepID=A0A833QFN3_9POAL|nr:scopoletin glucosyltransferase-like protein [Carex littledalei]